MNEPNARVRVLVSFNGMRAGDEAVVERDARVQAWISLGLVKVVDSGESTAGPGDAEPDAHRRKPKRAARSVPAGGESGEGFGTGGYGASESVDQG